MGKCSGDVIISIIVGLSALLVSTNRGNAKALTREASNRLAPRFFVYVRNLLLINRRCGSHVTQS